jgi:hypothetical protein
MPRALLELDHALPWVTKVPYAVVPALGGMNSKGWDDPGRLKLLLREYLKLLGAWGRNNLSTNSPATSPRR